MQTIQLDVKLVQFILDYLKTDHTTEDSESYNKNWKLKIDQAIQELEGAVQHNNYVEPGHRQIPHNPNRTDVGMGAILNTNSDFI